MRRDRFIITLFYLLAATVFFGVWLQAQLRQADSGSGQEDSYTALERYLLRHKLRRLTTPQPSDDVVVVSFGRKAVKMLGPYPWPRDIYADLIVRLRKQGARTIALDLLFADPQLRFLSPSAYRSLFPQLPLERIRIVNHLNYVKELNGKLNAERRKLAQAGATAAQLEAFRGQQQRLLALSTRIARGDSNVAFERAVVQRRDVVFPTDLSNVPQYPVPGSSKAALRLLQGYALDAPSMPLARQTRAMTLYPRLLAARPRLGFNGVDRDQRPFLSKARVLTRFDGRVYASQTAAAVAHFWGLRPAVLRHRSGPALGLGRARVALEPDGSFPIQFYNAPGFPRVISAIDVLRGKVPRATLDGKLVLVDVRIRRTSGFLRVPTPLSKAAWTTSVKATVASNMLLGHRGPMVHRPHWLRWIEGAGIWLIAALFALLARRPLVYSLAAGPLLVAALGGADLLLALPAGIWFSSGALVIEVPLLMISSVGAHYIMQRAERQKVRRAFGFYLPPNVLSHMLDDEGALKLGGERRDVSILFSDIRSFTNISERSEPEQLGEALNAHLTALTQVVFDHQGTLDKYMGDCIMAFFGAPVSGPRHPADAVLAALQMQKRLEQLQPLWRKCCGEDVRIGVGVATGEVIVGNMGSQTLFDYTVVGDFVNLASRLEGLTKDYGVQVLVSQPTRDRCGDGVALMEVDVVRVKGKDQPVRIFEALSAEDVDPPRRRYMEACEAGIAAYRDQRWDTARMRFEQAAAELPDQRLPGLYLERIELLATHDLPADWDGVTRFSHK